MWFGTLILKNIIRRPLRSCLTVFAIAIAIGAVVSLVGIAQGFQDSFLALYENVGIDIIVVRSGGRQRLTSSLDERLGAKIQVLSGVKDVLPGLVDLMAFQDYGVHSAVVQGFVPQTAVFDHLKLEAGRFLQTGDQKAVILGTILSRNMNKGVGDTLDLVEGETFTIVGVYSSYSIFENGAMVIPLREMQRILDRPGQVTGISVILDDQGKARIPELKKEIEALEKNIQALPTKDHVNSLTELKLARAMAWLTSAIALIIGLFGMMNTMVMAVNERTKEIGILRAVGWKPPRVLRLILFEAITLSLIGALVGILGSAILLRLLTQVRGVNGLIEGKMQPMLVLYAFVIAIGVGLLGGIIPARRAARLLPTEALRQE